MSDKKYHIVDVFFISLVCFIIGAVIGGAMTSGVSTSKTPANGIPITQMDESMCTYESANVSIQGCSAILDYLEDNSRISQCESLVRELTYERDRLELYNENQLRILCYSIGGLWDEYYGCEVPKLEERMKIIEVA